MKKRNKIKKRKKKGTVTEKKNSNVNYMPLIVKCLIHLKKIYNLNRIYKGVRFVP